MDSVGAVQIDTTSTRVECACLQRVRRKYEASADVGLLLMDSAEGALWWLCKFRPCSLVSWQQVFEMEKMIGPGCQNAVSRMYVIGSRRYL
jgi:hypothetical protein